MHFLLDLCFSLFLFSDCDTPQNIGSTPIVG